MSAKRTKGSAVFAEEAVSGEEGAAKRRRVAVAISTLQNVFANPDTRVGVWQSQPLIFD